MVFSVSRPSGGEEHGARADLRSDGIRIAFIDEGAGEPVLLIHGFASSVKHNWVEPGWVSLLIGARLPRRRHRQPRPRRERQALRPRALRRAADGAGCPPPARPLGHPRADVMGYSMGARITAFLALAHPERVRSAIFGGLGGNMVRPMAGTGPIAHALEADSIDEVKNPTARTFRAFAEQTGSDLKALAACIRGSRDPITREMVASLDVPGSGGDGHGGRDRRAGRGAGGPDPGRPGAADPAPRPHAGRRRPGLQGGRAGVFAAATVGLGSSARAASCVDAPKKGSRRLPRNPQGQTRGNVTGLAGSEMREQLTLRPVHTHFRAIDRSSGYNLGRVKSDSERRNAVDNLWAVGGLVIAGPPSAMGIAIS